MTFIIPNQQSKKHLQDNKSDITGTIYQSRNINLDEDGYIKLAEATYAQFTTDDDAEFNTVDAMFPSDSNIYMNSDQVFSGRAGIDYLKNHSGDTDSPTPSVEEDVVYFNGTEVVSDGGSIYYRSASPTWTSVSVSGSGWDTGSPTSMCMFEGANVLAVGNNNVVKFVDTSWAVSATVLVLPDQYRVSSMDSIGSNLYIATRNDAGTESMLFVAGGVQASADLSYPTGAWELMSIKRLKSSIVGINSLGEIIRFNGAGFDVLATLPVYKTNLEWGDALNDYSRVSNRALTVDGDLIYVNVDSRIYDAKYQAIPNFPAGVWCYDTSNGSFYHRYSPSYSRVQNIWGALVTVNTTDNNFTLTSGNLDTVMTGMPVMYELQSPNIPELRDGGEVYYIIKDSSTVFRLASTYTDALAGTEIDITGVGSTSQYFHIFKTNDYGWTRYGRNRMSMAILNSKIFDSKYAGRICMTARLFAKQNNSTYKSVFSPINPYLPNRGYFITPRLNSANIEDTHNALFIKYKPLGVDDSIIVKYKTSSRKDYPKSSVEFIQTADWKATWTDTDTFTTVADLSDAEVGDEIELIAGVGSGHMAHISSLSETAGTWTVKLDEAFPFAVASDVFYFNIDNWTRLATITNTTEDNNSYNGYFKAPITQLQNSKFIQFKVEMRGVGVTVEEMQVGTAKHIGV